ncbi:Lrp/AsnC ligand binding domain-containing protein [Candidatus Woesearchaeota archaeon]|nr:Lrp/AsnC ligand binding domain-containing protein [Candidatus Woesearchaeota archaeon]
MKAFVLISLKEGNERELLEELKELKEVKNAYILFGEWDLIVEAELRSAEELGAFVMDKIRNREDVRLTSSLIVAGK